MFLLSRSKLGCCRVEVVEAVEAVSEAVPPPLPPEAVIEAVAAVAVDPSWCTISLSVSQESIAVRHGLRTPREEIAFTAQPKIQSQSKSFKYGRSIFCLPHRPNFLDIFDLCLHWVSVVRA